MPKDSPKSSNDVPISHVSESKILEGQIVFHFEELKQLVLLNHNFLSYLQNHSTSNHISKVQQMKSPHLFFFNLMMTLILPLRLFIKNRQNSQNLSPIHLCQSLKISKILKMYHHISHVVFICF